MDWAQVVREEIQRGYGDATQTPLDGHVASEIVSRLRSMGWADPDEVRALVAGAGGEIVVSRRHLTDPPRELLVMDDHSTMGKRVLVR